MSSALYLLLKKTTSRKNKCFKIDLNKFIIDKDSLIITMYLCVLSERSAFPQSYLFLIIMSLGGGMLIFLIIVTIVQLTRFKGKFCN